jgi:hypothetical protein
MTEEEIKRELQNLNEELALLQQEHAKTRNGWLYSLRNTGFLLAVFAWRFCSAYGNRKRNSIPTQLRSHLP